MARFFLAASIVLYNVLFFGNPTTAQDGLPNVHTFSAESIGTNKRLFAVAQDQYGLLYVASADEDLVFYYDGSRWGKLELPSSPFDLVAGEKGRIWIALENGVGWIEVDPFGRPQFQRLKVDFEKSDNLDFRYARTYTSDTVSGVRLGNRAVAVEIDTSSDPVVTNIIRAANEELLYGYSFPKLVSVKQHDSVQEIVNGERQLMFEGADLEFDEIVELGPEDHVFVRHACSTLDVRRGGQWKSFSPDFQKHLKDGLIRHVFPISEDRIVCATSVGIFCLDLEGNILYRMDNRNGLLNDQILSGGVLPSGQIWLTYFSTGFSILDQDLSQKSFPFPDNTPPVIFDILPTKERLFLGRNDGLFTIDVNEELRFRDASDFRSEIRKWDSTCIYAFEKQNEDEVLVATEKGIVELVNDRKRRRSQGKTRNLFVTKDSHILVRLGNGQTQIFQDDEDGFTKINTLESLFDPYWFFEGDNRILWLFGKENVAVLQFENGWNQPPLEILRSNELGPMWPVEIMEELFVYNSEGIFKPVLADNSMSLESQPQFAKLDQQFKQRTISQIFSCDEHGLMLVDDNSSTLHPLKGGIYRSAQSAEWFWKDGIAQGSFWDPDRNIAWNLQANSIVAQRVTHSRMGHYYPPHIQINAKSKFELVSGTDDSPVRFKLPSAGKITFDYSLPFAEFSPNKKKFQYRLNGLEDWSTWTEENSQEYARLPGGEYHFEVRVKGPSGQFLTSSTQRFFVKPFWYMTRLAWLGFAFFGASGVYLASAFRTRRLRAANRKMEAIVAQRTVEIERKRNQLVEFERTSESERLESFDTLVAGIAHDFNNLLTVISLNNDLMAHRFGVDATSIAESSQSAIETAKNLCQEMSTISNSAPLSLSSLSASEFIDSMKPIIESSVSESIALNFSRDSNPDYFVGDAHELRRVILNLLVNAGEFAKSKIDIRTFAQELTVQDLETARFVGPIPSPGDYVSIEVCNDGDQIPAERMNRLFDAFFSSREFGRGLGLAIVMRIVGRHEGVVFVESEASVTRFRISIPADLAHVSDRRSRESKRAKVRISSTLDHKEPALDYKVFQETKILVVDDDSAVLLTTRCILETMGHRVVTALSAREGLRKLSKDPEIEFLLLDLTMPEMSGGEMAAIVVQEYEELPIVFVSGYSPNSVAPEILTLPTVSFLAKPFTIASLKKKIVAGLAVRKAKSMSQCSVDDN